MDHAVTSLTPSIAFLISSSTIPASLGHRTRISSYRLLLGTRMGSWHQDLPASFLAGKSTFGGAGGAGLGAAMSVTATRQTSRERV